MEPEKLITRLEQVEERITNLRKILSAESLSDTARDELGLLQAELARIADDLRARRRDAAPSRFASAWPLALVDAMPVGVLVTDALGAITLINLAARQMLGGDVSGSVDAPNPGYTFCYPDGRPISPEEQPLQRALASGQPVESTEIMIRRADGSTCITLTSAAPLRAEDGALTGALAVLRDITERHTIKAELGRHIQRLQLIRDLDRAILAAQSLDKIGTAALDQLCRLVPYRYAGIILPDGETGHVVIYTSGDGAHPVEREHWPVPFDQILPKDELTGGQPWLTDDLQAGTAAGPWLEHLAALGLRTCLTVPLLAQGRLVGALSLGTGQPWHPLPADLEVISEVTDHLAIAIEQASLYEQIRRYADKLEERVAQRTLALRQSEARFRAIFDGAAVGIALVDSAGRVLEGNPALREILDVSDADLRDYARAPFLPSAEPAPDTRATFENLMAGKRKVYRAELSVAREGKPPVWVSVTAVPMRRVAGEPPLAAVMVEDVTDRRQTQAALLRTERQAMAGRLAASLTHEINNPLQAVIGCLGLAEETLHENGDVTEYLTVAREELRRVTGVVSQLRDLQRPAASVERQPTAVNELLERILTLSQKKCADQGVEIAWQPAPDLPLVSLAPDQMQQVFLNLLLNALDAMPGGGQLRITTAAAPTEAASVRIVFADTGEGIAPDAMGRLFEPFFSTKPKGLGLGLFTTRKIVEEHGGRITVESQPGKGTQFTVWLPAEDTGPVPRP